MKKLIFVFVICMVMLCGCSLKSEWPKKVTCDTMNEYIKEADVALIDVRSEQEFQKNHLSGAINIPLAGLIESVKNSDKITKDTKIMVYCQSGKRSKEAAKELVKEGYKKVYDLGAITKCLPKEK